MKSTVVKTYKGEHAAERGIEQMRKRGYEIDQTSTRKVAWSPVTGLFTRKQKHTIVFRKTTATNAPSLAGPRRDPNAPREHGPTCVCADCCAERLAKPRKRR